MLETLADSLLDACQPATTASPYALQGCLYATAVATQPLPQIDGQQPALQHQFQQLPGSAPFADPMLPAASQEAQAVPEPHAPASGQPDARSSSVNRSQQSGPGPDEDLSLKSLPEAMRHRLVDLAAEWLRRVLTASGQPGADVWQSLGTRPNALSAWNICLDPLRSLLACSPSLKAQLMKALPLNST